MEEIHYLDLSDKVNRELTQIQFMYLYLEVARHFFCINNMYSHFSLDLTLDSMENVLKLQTVLDFMENDLVSKFDAEKYTDFFLEVAKRFFTIVLNISSIGVREMDCANHMHPITAVIEENKLILYFNRKFTCKFLKTFFLNITMVYGQLEDAKYSKEFMDDQRRPEVLLPSVISNEHLAHFEDSRAQQENLDLKYKINATCAVTTGQADIQLKLLEMRNTLNHINEILSEKSRSNKNLAVLFIFGIHSMLMRSYYNCFNRLPCATNHKIFPVHIHLQRPVDKNSQSSTRGECAGNRDKTPSYSKRPRNYFAQSK